MVVKRRLKLKPIIFIIILALFMFLLAFTWIYLTQPVDSKNSKDIDITIPSGTSTSAIGSILKSNNLIKNEIMFKIYVKLNTDGSLKAGTYRLNKSMSLSEIVEDLDKGKIYNSLRLTFKEGERLTDYAEVIAENTNSNYDEVIEIINDESYLNELINKYWFLTTDILNSDIYYPLEGYLAPETYHFVDENVEVKEIIETMLDQTEKNLEPYKNSLGNRTIHEIMTMASVAELEGTNSENKKMIVGIFYNRLNSGFNMGSDVTTYYALQRPMTSDLTSAQFATNNPYNTRSTSMIGKLPVGPICNPTLESIEATINYTDNDYLFFVADKNGNIYYSKTNAEHEQKIAEIKNAGNWIW